MAEAYKVLGQAAPNATTETTLYTVPAATSAIVSTVFVCNRSAVTVTFRLYVAVAGAATATKMYLAYDVPLVGNSFLSVTVGLTLGTSDVLRCYASTADVSFNVFGLERT